MFRLYQKIENIELSAEVKYETKRNYFFAQFILIKILLISVLIIYKNKTEGNCHIRHCPIIKPVVNGSFPPEIEIGVYLLVSVPFCCCCCRSCCTCCCEKKDVS